MISVYAAELCHTTQKTGIGAQKIDGLLLKTYDMISARTFLCHVRKATLYLGNISIPEEHLCTPAASQNDD